MPLKCVASNACELLFNFVSVKRYILLDGYNIIYACDALKHLMPNNKSRARESLAEMVQSIHSVEDVHIIIVFDSSNKAIEMEYPFRDKTFEFVATKKKNKLKLIGLGFSIQETSNIPNRAWDLPLQYIVTEKEFICVEQK